MILYFSGTGNSRYVARELATRLGDEAVEILDANFSENPPEAELGFVFPVYSWGIAPLLLDIIKKRIPESWWKSVKKVWCVLACGDETGLAHIMLLDAIKRRGAEVESIWSIIMPNNYVLLPGFDVDPVELERKKLEASASRIEEISQGIKKGERKIDVVKGKFAGLKTHLIYPLFKRWGIIPKKWHSTAGCIGCGKCTRICPLKNVRMSDDRPVWGSHCCSCLACYHVCPRHAVAYGKITSSKGQYFLPAHLR